MNLGSIGDTILAALVPLLGAFFLARSEQFKAWRAAKKTAKEERKAVPASIARIADSVDKLTASDGRRTAQFTNIELVLREHTETLKAQNVALGDIASMAYGQMEQDPTPRFVCDNDGSNRLVNTAYARLMHCGRDELMAFGYRRFTPDNLNPGYIDRFHDAASQHRTFESEVLFLRPDGSMFYGRVRLVPHPEDAPPATHWNGTIRFLREYTAE